MRFNPKARLDPSQVEDRGGGGGSAAAVAVACPGASAVGGGIGAA